MRRLTRRIITVGTVRSYAQQPLGHGPFQLGKALRLVQDLPSATDAITRVSVALGLSEPPSMDKLTMVIKEIDNKWDYDNHIKFNNAFLENIQVVPKEFVLEHCQHIDQLGKFFSYNKPLTINIKFIEQLISKGANIAYFMKSVNEINQSIRIDGKIDPDLLELQFTYLHANNSTASVGVMVHIPEYIRADYINDNQFIDRYMKYFNKIDWIYIVNVRKEDREFIRRHWDKLDHSFYFQQCNKFTYDAVKQVMEDGYIDELTPDIWESVLQKVEKDGQLELLYELCGSKIQFPLIHFEGDINIYVPYIPGIESIRNDTVPKLFDRDAKRSLCGVFPKSSNMSNEILKPLGMVYNDNPTCLDDHVSNIVTTIMATYALSVSGRPLFNFKGSTQTQCSNTLKRVLPIYLNNRKQKTVENITTTKD